MEQPLDRFRSSTRGWLRGTLAGWGTILLGLAGLAATAIGERDRYPLLLTGLAIAILFYVWVRNLGTSFELSQDRLVIRRGIFIKSIDEIELYRIKDIRLDFSLINQLAGIGTIGITSSDETTRGLTLPLRHVERAQQRREELRRLVDAARQRRRVHEIDMVHEDI